jgi:hypothetical protein
MAKKQADAPSQPRTPAKGVLPQTQYTGVNASNTSTVIVSALLEVTGHVRFGDGTDIATTVTEKDTVARPGGGSVEKAIWAGTKRRGVDRRTIHELRDRLGWNEKCYIPELCGMCPICWLYGFTGTTQERESPVKGINAKSRVLYSTSVSVEEVARCVSRHSRNQVDEKSQTTAGTAGIHEEEVIVGAHFPVYTSLLHVLDWEIGAFAHAFLEDINQNRYTAASRGQGGIRFAENNQDPILIVDESPTGVFPLSVPKVPAWETDYAKVAALFASHHSSSPSLVGVRSTLQAQGFAVEGDTKTLTARAGSTELIVEATENFLVVRQGSDELMKRYYGNQALGFLRQKQIGFQKTLADPKWRGELRDELRAYAAAIQKKEPSKESTGATPPEPGTNPEEGAPDDGTGSSE